MTSVIPRINDRGAPRPEVLPRLVALDLDGTCLDTQQRLHPRTRAAVRQVARRMPVIIATGRMYSSTVVWARELQVTAPLVCYQGAVVRELPDGDGGVPGRLVYEDALGVEPAVRALRLARANNWHFQAYRDDRLLCEQDRPEARLYASIAQTTITFVDDLEPFVRMGTVKAICVIDDDAEVDRCETLLRAELGDTARVLRSLPPFVEIISPVAGKGRAVRQICERLGLGMAEVLAIGDAPNDIDLLTMAGFAVAVAGSRPEVVAAADVLCGPPQEGGVADVLRSLGLAG